MVTDDAPGIATSRTRAAPSHERADVLLVRKGLFESRGRAQEAIAARLVTADGILVDKAAAKLRVDAAFVADRPHPWVSRGGVKLVGALDAFGFDPAGKTCLDIGASTGGFTDVLLARGAKTVFAVDVGHGQLHPRIADDARVVAMEGCDARRLRLNDGATAPDLIVCDVSFISLRLVLPPVLSLAADAADLVCLIKPQFEAGPGRSKKGIVRDAAIHDSVCASIAALVRGLDWTVKGIIPSPIEGGDGNREFLIGASRS